MNLHNNRSRPITNQEKENLDYIEKLLSNNDSLMSPNELIFMFIKIKCATEDGFFDSMMKHAFSGFYTQNDKLRQDVHDLSSGLVMAELAIPKHKKKQKRFKELNKYSILKALKVAKSFFNLDDVIKEYESE